MPDIRDRGTISIETLKDLEVRQKLIYLAKDFCELSKKLLKRMM